MLVFFCFCSMGSILRPRPRSSNTSKPFFRLRVSTVRHRQRFCKIEARISASGTFDNYEKPSGAPPYDKFEAPRGPGYGRVPCPRWTRVYRIPGARVHPRPGLSWIRVYPGPGYTRGSVVRAQTMDCTSTDVPGTKIPSKCVRTLMVDPRCKNKCKTCIRSN